MIEGDSMKKSFSDKVIIFIFILAVLFGLFFLFIFPNIKSIMFWYFLIWTLLYLFLIYSYINKERSNKVEKGYKDIVIPILEDIGTSLFVLVPLIGLVYSIICIIHNEDISNSIGVLIIMSLFLIMDVYFIKKEIYTFNFIDYLKKKNG